MSNSTKTVNVGFVFRADNCISKNKIGIPAFVLDKFYICDDFSLNWSFSKFLKKGEIQT